MGWPKKDDVQEVLKKIKDSDFIEIPTGNLSSIEKTKINLCREFIVYMREEELNQADLARKLGVDRPRVNNIIRYKIDKFTIDKLLDLLAKIKPIKELLVS